MGAKGSQSVFFEQRAEGSWALWLPQFALYPDPRGYYIGFVPRPFKHGSERKEAPFQPDLFFYGLPAHSLSGSLKALAKTVNIPGAARAELKGEA